MLNRWTRLPTPPRFALAPLLALGLLVACTPERTPVPGAPDEPVAAVEALAGALRDGDIARYAALSVPPAMQAAQVAMWERRRADAGPTDAAQAERFAELMAELSAPGAEQALWDKTEPRLAALKDELGPKWTLGVTMLSGFATTAIAADETLSEAEKAHATSVVRAVSTWAGDQTLFTDPDRARAAIGIATATARELDLPSVEAVRALDHPTMLAKAGVAFRGLKAVGRAYGVDADAALAEVTAEVVALEGTRAVVRVRYPLLGETIEFEQPMLLVDGGWYREDAVRSLEAALAAAPVDAAAAPAATPAP